MEKEGKIMFNKIIFIFVIGSILGTYYEEILHFVTVFLKTGTISWVSRRGLLYGPFSPIYGIACVLVYLIFGIKKRVWWKTFLYGSLLGGAYEYGMSFLQEKIWGSISWDYSHHFLNIGGRTTIPFMVFWGLVVLLLVYVLFPCIEHIFNKMSMITVNRLAEFLFIFLAFDVTISLVAVSRQSLRHEGIRPQTPIGEFCDQHFTDEYLKKIYDNAKFVKAK